MRYFLSLYNAVLEPCSTLLYAGHFSWLLQEENRIANRANVIATDKSFFIIENIQ